jgi:hypothetical protein
VLKVDLAAAFVFRSENSVLELGSKDDTTSRTLEFMSHVPMLGPGNLVSYVVGSWTPEVKGASWGSIRLEDT